MRRQVDNVNRRSRHLADGRTYRQSSEFPSVRGADGLTGWAIVIVRQVLPKLYFLRQIKSYFDETWYEYVDKQSYRAHFEYFHKLC